MRDYVIINKNDGNILRINNILKNIKKEKKKRILSSWFCYK